MKLKNYLMITSLKIITAGPPYPWDLHKPQIENIWEKKFLESSKNQNLNLLHTGDYLFT